MNPVSNLQREDPTPNNRTNTERKNTRTLLNS